MYSIINKNRMNLAISLAIALAGAITPAGAFATSPTPKPSTPVIHQIIRASQKAPQMAIPGDTVDVTLRTGVTQVVLVGPVIPQVSADALPGTFTFTFLQKSGKTLINIRDFGILDGAAALIRPIRFDDGSTSFYLKAGDKRSVKLTTFMAVGTGTLRWAPLNHYVTDWQFVEETA
jgi:hypothetical protein